MRFAVFVDTQQPRLKPVDEERNMHGSRVHKVSCALCCPHSALGGSHIQLALLAACSRCKHVCRFVPLQLLQVCNALCVPICTASFIVQTQAQLHGRPPSPHGYSTTH